MEAADKKEKKVQEHKFTKEQLVSSEKFREDRDILEAVLTEDIYTVSEAEKKVSGYKKGRVK